jgi:hypothetical protein
MGLLFLAVMVGSVFGSAVSAQLPPPPPPLVPNLTPPTLTPSLPNPTTSGLMAPVPVPQVPMIPVAAIARTTMPPTIRPMRPVVLLSAERMDLGYLVTRLSEVDTAILQYQREVGAESFNNLLNTLLLAVSGRAPDLSSNLEESLPRIRALLNERAEVNRRIMRIVTPGASMKPAPYIEPTRSGPADSHYQVYSSNTTTTGAVVAPYPSPACHKEVRTRREYRNVLLPNGFDGNGTPLYRNEYHPFPVSVTVDVCP